jgi:chromosome segregation ATPase
MIEEEIQPAIRPTTDPVSVFSLRRLKGDRRRSRTRRFVTERNLAKELAHLATQADSLEKTLVRAWAEREREAEHRKRAEAEAEELRQQLRHARHRAKVAEHEVANATAKLDAVEHAANGRESELREQIDQLAQTKRVLRHEVEQTERERRALELNYREVLANLRHAAQEARTATHVRPAAEEVPLLPVDPPDNGW